MKEKVWKKKANGVVVNTDRKAYLQVKRRNHLLEKINKKDEDILNLKKDVNDLKHSVDRIERMLKIVTGKLI